MAKKNLGTAEADALLRLLSDPDSLRTDDATTFFDEAGWISQGDEEGLGLDLEEANAINQEILDRFGDIELLDLARRTGGRPSGGMFYTGDEWDETLRQSLELARPALESGDYEIDWEAIRKATGPVHWPIRRKERVTDYAAPDPEAAQKRLAEVEASYQSSGRWHPLYNPEGTRGPTDPPVFNNAFEILGRNRDAYYPDENVPYAAPTSGIVNEQMREWGLEFNDIYLRHEEGEVRDEELKAHYAKHPFLGGNSANTRALQTITHNIDRLGNRRVALQSQLDALTAAGKSIDPANISQVNAHAREVKKLQDRLEGVVNDEARWNTRLSRWEATDAARSERIAGLAEMGEAYLEGKDMPIAESWRDGWWSQQQANIRRADITAAVLDPTKLDGMTEQTPSPQAPAPAPTPAPTPTPTPTPTQQGPPSAQPGGTPTTPDPTATPGAPAPTPTPPDATTTAPETTQQVSRAGLDINGLFNPKKITGEPIFNIAGSRRKETPWNWNQEIDMGWIQGLT